MANLKVSRSIGLGFYPSSQLSYGTGQSVKVSANDTLVFGVSATTCRQYSVLSKNVASLTSLKSRERSRIFTLQQSLNQRLNSFNPANLLLTLFCILAEKVLSKSTVYMHCMSLTCHDASCLQVSTVLRPNGICSRQFRETWLK